QDHVVMLHVKSIVRTEHKRPKEVSNRLPSSVESQLVSPPAEELKPVPELLYEFIVQRAGDRQVARGARTAGRSQKRSIRRLGDWQPERLLLIARDKAFCTRAVP